MIRRVKPLLLLGLVGLLANGCGRGLLRKSPPKEIWLYPHWFTKMPQRPGVIFAVGYSPVYMNIQSSWQEAKDNALLNLARAYFVSVQGEQAFVSRGEGTAYKGSTISEEVDSTLLESLKPKLNCLDSARVGGMVIVLVSTMEVQVDDRPTDLKSQEPAWVKELPSNPDYEYARGASPKYLYESTSWLKAERAARIQLAWNRKRKLQRLQRKGEDNLHQVTVESTGVVLRELQIIARWVDPVNGVHWVLAHCPKRVSL